MNIEHYDKREVITWKNFVLKLWSILDFHSEYYIPAI